MKVRKNVYGFCPACTKDSPEGTKMERRENGNSTCGFCKKTTPSAKWLRVSFPVSLHDAGEDRSEMN